MGVSLLLITHDNIGSSLLSTVTNMMGVCPIDYRNLSITPKMDIEQGYTQASQLCSELNEENDILIITDIYGSTPSNIARKLLAATVNNKRMIVTGINLPMLVKIMNYAHLELPELIEKACSGAKDSIFVVDNSNDCQ